MSSDGKKTGMEEGGTPALVPKLRFSEFLGNGGWTETPLNAAAQINPSNNGLPESFIYIDLEAVDAGQLKAKSRISRNEAPSRAQRLVERGDIIYQVVRPYQRNNLLCEFDDHDDYVASTGYAQLRAIGSNHFLYQSIHTETFVRRVITKCTGSNYPAINSSDLAEIELPIPPTLAEQQKIAECLTSLDELIAAQACKVDALKKHKKGLMQQLFPREGETHPRLRFPEFQNDGDWKKVTFGNAATFHNGRAFKQEELLEFGKYPVLRVGNFFTNNAWYYSDLELDETKYCDQGDLLYAWSASFGPRLWHGNKTIYHYHIWKVIERRGIDKRFLFISLENETEKMKAKTTNGLGIMHITKGAIESWETNFPAIEEQQHIADCLSSLDTLVTAGMQKLEAFNRYKRGLMQQLFPSPVEVEG